MDIWVVLGIAMTKDEDAINEAYREKLQYVHPEDHPEEFMELRSAYDEAIKYARRKDEEEQKEKTPVDLWIDRVEAVYNDLSRRINIGEWKALLDDDICQGIDSRLDARDAFLKFGMECFYLPAEIWQLLEETFSFKENRAELYEKFPRDYIDNAVIDGADGYPVVSYSLFAEGTTGNPDDYIRLYNKARRERSDRNYEACAATIEDMKNSGFEHPCTRLAEAELLYVQDKDEEAWVIVDELRARYPEDITIRLVHGEIARNHKKDYETSLADYQMVLDKFPKHNQATWGKAECLLAQDKLEEAKEEYLRLNQRLPFDESISNRITEVNQKLVDRYEKLLVENPDDFEMRMDYAWSCLQRKENDRAKELIADAKPADIAQQADLENFSTKLYLNCNEPEEGLRHAQIWETLIPQLPEGETDQEKKRKGKLAEILYLQAAALSMLERYDEALEKADASQAANPKKTDAYDIRRRVYIVRRQFDKAAEQSEKLVELDPNYNNWFSLAYDQFNMGDKAAAYHSFGEALNYGRVLQAYLYRARILCDFDEWDGVKQMTEYLTENGVEEDSGCVRYLNGRMLQNEDKKDEALEKYKAIIDDFESGGQKAGGVDSDLMADVYYRSADIQDDNGTAPEDLMLVVGKGLEEKDDYLPLLDLKSYLLWKQKKRDEFMELNKHILELYPSHRAANERIGDVLYDEKNEYQQALEYYRRQEPLRDSAPLQEVMGLCLMYLEQPEESELHFKNAIELDPERLRPRSNLGLLYERLGQHEKSLPLQEECVRINLEKEKGDKRPYRWLARNRARMRKYEDAMEAYRKNLELYGEDEDARHVVEVCMESGDFVRAEKLLEQFNSEGKIGDPYLRMKTDIIRLQGKNYLRYIKKMEDDSNKYERLASYYLGQKKYQKALEYYKKVDEIDPEYAGRLTGYIHCLRELGRDEERREMVKRNLEYCEAISKNGWRKPLYLIHKAYVLLADRQLEEAMKYIELGAKAPMCDHCRYSKCKDAIGALGEYYELIGEYQKALDTYREGLEIAPDDFDFPENIKKLKKEHKVK